jgi:hypothetical protein
MKILNPSYEKIKDKITELNNKMKEKGLLCEGKNYQ